MKKYVVDTAATLRLCQQGLQAGDASVVEAAETMMSALVLHLRHPQALVPDDTKFALQALRDYDVGCKVNDVGNTNTQ